MSRSDDMAVTAPTLDSAPAELASHVPKVQVPIHGGDDSDVEMPLRKTVGNGNGNGKVGKRAVGSGSSSEDEKPLVSILYLDRALW